MKIIETGPREIGFVSWGHCQNLLDDPRIIYALLYVQLIDNDPFRLWYKKGILSGIKQ